MAVPPGFVLQKLDPVGGEILRPKDWFFREEHSGPSLTWIVSKEKSSNGAYETGVRIQLLVGVQKGTGKTPKEFVHNFIAQKRKTAAKMIDECKPTDQGLFTRVCLQTIEGPHHILYSLFWGNSADIVGVVIAGAKKEEWSKYAETFDRMSEMKIIDMEHLEKQAREQKP